MNEGGPPTSRRWPRLKVRRVSARAIGWPVGGAACAGAVLAYYLWTVSSTASPFSVTSRSGGSYYNLLADAFLHGKLHLLVKPSSQLLQLRDPYDPIANATYRLHDVALYHGHYYLPWGPTPTLLYIPFRALGLGDISDTLAAALFAFVGTIFAAMLLRHLARRFVPAAPRWMVALGVLALPFASALPFVLRRVAVYEVSITGAFCFAMAGVYLLTKEAFEPTPRLRRLVLGSLCLGVAAGSRQTMVIAALLLPCAYLVQIDRRRASGSRRQRLWTALALLGPAVVCLCILGFYNYARFGSLTEFGQHYQLAGYDPHDKTFGSLAYVLPGIWYYLFARAHVTAAFPFFNISPSPESYPGTLPSSYSGLEPTAGLISNVPIIALAFVVPLGLLRRRSERGLWLALTTLGCLGALLLIAASYSLWGATMRYEVDFATLFFVVAVLAWLALAAMIGRRRRILVQIVGVLAILWGIFFGASMGMSGYNQTLMLRQPGTFDLLARFTTPVANVITRLEGRAEVIRVTPLQQVAQAPSPDAGPNVKVGARAVSLYVSAPSAGTYRLTAATEGDSWRVASGNLCLSCTFVRSFAGWGGLSGQETLALMTTGHAGHRALRVTIPDAPLQGVVYTRHLHDVRSDEEFGVSAWVKGSPGTPLEVQVRIVNVDGSATGGIRGFRADGRWQHESAKAAVGTGATPQLVQILVIRRDAAPADTFRVDDAQLRLLASRTSLTLGVPGKGPPRPVYLAQIATGVPIDLHRGVNRLTVATQASGVALDNVQLAHVPG
jgi:hypothetical protein